MRNDYEVAVLVSGGLDSTVAFYNAKRVFGKKDVVGVFVNYEQPYLVKEDVAINKVLYNENIISISTELCQLQRKVTLDDPEVYGRNALLTFYGALHAKRVWISSLESEVGIRPGTWDHGPTFNYTASALFSQVFQSLRQQTVVESPFSEMTKSDVLKMGLKVLGLTSSHLLDTVSCYAETEHPCGDCKACFKRWVALTNNGITGERFINQPQYSVYAAETIISMRQVVERNAYDARFTKARCIETHNAMVRGKVPGGRVYSKRDIIDGSRDDVHCSASTL